MLAAARRPVLTLVLLPLALPQPVPDSGNGFAFSVYYPQFVQHPLERYIETSHGYMVQPPLAVGGNATHPMLITQDYSSRPLRSVDGGMTWSPLCATTAGSIEGMRGGEREAATPWSGRPAGIGMLPDGTLLVGTGTQPPSICGTNPWVHNCSMHVYLFRIALSDDGNCSWGEPYALPTLSAGKPCANRQHCDNVGGDATNRFHVASDGSVYYTGTNLRSPPAGQSLPPDQQYDYSVAYRSTDNGHTFFPTGVIGRHIAEVDILPLPSTGTQVPEGQHLLASIRYQQSTPMGGGTLNVSDYWAGYYKQTGITRSTDGGRTWEEPGIVTGYLQQTGSLARLDDGTIILAFGHKDSTQDPTTKQWVMYGQRCIVSYDNGRTFSRRIFELHSGSMYAATVALPKASTDALEGQLLVTACANSTGVAGNLHVLRWFSPKRTEVAAGGFFQPVTPSCGVLAQSHTCKELANDNNRLRRMLEASMEENERLRAAAMKK